MIPPCITRLLKDHRISNTQKYFFMVILALDSEQGYPKELELPVRSFEPYGANGHGNIKNNLEALKQAGYLLDIGWLKRDDGYRVTSVTINRNFFQMLSSLQAQQQVERKDDDESEGVE